MKTAYHLVMTAALLTLSGLAASPSPAQADPVPTNTYTYRLKTAATQGQTCASHAFLLTQSFENETGLAQATTTCEPSETLTENGTQYVQEVMVISYQATAPADPYQAILGGQEFMGHADAGSALFATYANCLAELNQLEPQFQAETGFAALDAHCDPADALEGAGYSLTIEGFGQPTRSFFAFAEDPIVEGDAYAADVTQAAAQALKVAGADVAFADATHVFYYASSDPSVTEEDLGTFSVGDECKEQLTTAKAIFDAAGLTGATAFCEPFGSANSTELSLVVVGAGMSSADDDYGAGSPAYDSYAECQGDLPRLIANASQGGGKVLGGICAPNPDSETGYQARLFTDNY